MLVCQDIIKIMIQMGSEHMGSERSEGLSWVGAEGLGLVNI